MNGTEALLRAILATTARAAFPPSEVIKVVCPKAGSERQLAAYNLCDGETSQSEICKRAKLDGGNLSRSISRWIEAGIIVRVGPEQLPLHIYPLSKDIVKAALSKR